MFTIYSIPRGSRFNSAREIDLAEISRWGWNHIRSLPVFRAPWSFRQQTLCEGNTQFALLRITRNIQEW